jgi:hypothetical protein
MNWDLTVLVVIIAAFLFFSSQK